VSALVNTDDSGDWGKGKWSLEKLVVVATTTTTMRMVQNGAMVGTLSV